MRPKETGLLLSEPKAGEDSEQGRCGIIIQGPLQLQDDFTRQTALLYKRFFPRATLVLSTWKDQEALTRSLAEEVGCAYVVSDPPAYRGPQNVNSQARSTRAGLAYLREKGCEYALKTRSDQRVSSPLALHYLRSLLRAHPAGKFATAAKQKGRLVALSCYTRLNMPYHVCDFLSFGHLEDVARLWSLPDVKPEEVGPSYKTTAEIDVTRHFLNKLGWPLAGTPDDYRNVLREFFCLINHSHLDLFWCKYESWSENRCEPHVFAGSETPSSGECYTHEQWHTLVYS